ncbi:fructose-bisphosphate aldolase class-II family protein [Shigella flexneri]
MNIIPTPNGQPGTDPEILQNQRRYLQGQLANPKGEDQPKEKYDDSRAWLRAAQTSMVTRLEQAFQKELNAIDVL